MSERYEIDGFEVVFVPWHSEYMNEDFMAVYVLKDGREVMHAGMTHIEPTEEAARNNVVLVLETLERLNGDAE